jgi:Methylase involved in ubiquinone/menaquinone biosynthesis
MERKMIDQVMQFTKRPKLYEKSTSIFWDDEHISKGLLEAHLDPTVGDASRKPEFIEQSAEWITSIAAPEQYTDLLDLGCGPGLYTERFFQKGYQVTGMDFSKRSIAYAKESAAKKSMTIAYFYQNYLELSYEEEFDLITLIFCDYGAMSEENRKLLLSKIYRALRPNGKLIVDAYTPKMYEDMKENRDWSCDNGSFWCNQPNLCVNSFLKYEEENCILVQNVVITENQVDCYNIWSHAFTPKELRDNLMEGGFATLELYNDVAGADFTEDNITVCAVATK